jgi:colicin import membrane protein
MWKFLSQYGLFLTLSVTMHVLVVAALLLGFAATPELPKPLGASKKKNVIQAVAIDESQVQAELRKLDSDDKRKKQQESERQKRLQDEARKAEQQRIMEQEKLVAIKQQQQQEQARLQKQKQEQERKISELKKKQEQEQQRIQKLKTAAAELEKKKVAEKKRQQQLKEEKAAAEKKRQQQLKEEKAAAEKKRQQQQLREAQARRERALKEQIAAEEQAERERELQGVRSRYIDSIAAVVRGNWRRPARVEQDASCLIVVTQIPGGEIISYRVSSCTGGTDFQRSVETAVGKTSHLPAPPDPRVFDRVIRFTFTSK